MMNLFKRHKKQNAGNGEAYALYTKLSEPSYKSHPYETNDLDEGMSVVNESINQYWKPRFLLDHEAKCAYEFMKPNEMLCTITEDDIDWDSMKGLPESCITRAKNLDFHFPSVIEKYKNGVAQVRWQLNPDGMYYMDEDGYGMSDDESEDIYGFIDRQGKVVSKFRYISGNWKKLKEMRAEAEKKVNKISESGPKKTILSKARLLGRLYGFCWVLIEKRDPKYDGEKLKGQAPMMLVLQSMGFANKEELEVINKAVDAINHHDNNQIVDSSEEQREYLIGALEGKLIEYQHMNPHVLLEDKEINSNNNSNEQTNMEQNETKTQVFNVIILDKSGSMESIRQSAIDGFNETLNGIKKAQEKFADTQEHFVSLVAFCACEMKQIFDKVPVADAKPLTAEDYRPCCCTPLYDAMGFTLNGMRKHVKAIDDAVVVVTIITDGLENASKEYNGKSIKELVEQLKGEGWTFTYMGANQDALEVAERMSIRNSRNFDCTHEGTRASMAKDSRTRMNFFSRLACFKSNAMHEGLDSAQLKENYCEMADEAFDEEENSDDNKG
ncbi:MAG: hypothetical protein MJZ20_02230 [Bacteroidaceae bacterium]|nr:hypothetical protein [Bacteroidaceae bacterium]